MKVNPQKANFDGLDDYTAHMSAMDVVMPAPGFDRFVSDRLKTQALISKARRQDKEERDAVVAAEKKRGGKGNSKGEEP